MSAIISGSSPSVQFSDGTTQATSAIVSGYVPYANLPAGSVLQVAQGILTSYQSTTSSTYQATSCAVTITPKYSTSKILITCSLSGSQSASNGEGLFTVYRGATDLAPVAGGGSNGFNLIYTNASYSNPFRIPVIIQYLDSPSTTSSTTYTVYIKTNTVGTVALNQDSSLSIITAMEIAG